MSKRYSPSGNILTTQRNGIVGWDVQEQPVISSIDNMTYTYTGAAQLQSITDSRPGLQGFASGTTAYTYDGRGNVTGASGRRAYGITYNPLDLPYRIEGKTRDEIWYTHSREKLRVCQQEGQNDVCRLYLGNLELEWDPITETYKPKAWHHPEGKMMLHAEPQSNIKDRIRLHYYLRDHLGNTVVAFDDRNYDGAISDVEEGTQSEVIGRYHYYAFGMQWNHAWVGSDIGGYWKQRYRYNGKLACRTGRELHSNSGLLDYGFRYYDPSVGRFTGVDPLAEKMPGWSSYSYAFNNPIRFIDPDGRAPQDKIIETSKGNFKYVKDQYGTNFISTHYLNGDVAYTRKGHGTVMLKSGHAERKMDGYRTAVAKRREVVAGIGKAMENIGDQVATAGYIATPFTNGASLGVSAIGEGVSVAGKIITNSVKLEENGLTNENVIDAGADILFELFPAPTESAIKASNADNVTKKILKAELQTVNKAVEYGVDKTIEKSRSND